MSYILDALSLIIVCFFAWRLSKKGFVKAVVLFFGFVIAAVVAKYAAMPIANFIYDSFISEKVTETITLSLSKSSFIGSINDLSTEIETALDSLHPIFRNASGALMGTSEAETAVSSAMVEAGKTLSESIESEVVKPAALTLLQSVLFIILLVASLRLRKIHGFFRGMNSWTKQMNTQAMLTILARARTMPLFCSVVAQQEHQREFCLQI